MSEIMDSETRLPQQSPIVTYALLVVLVLITVVMTATGESTSIDNLLRFGAQLDSLVLQGEYWRLITAMFIHIGVIHLLCNGYALYVLGKDCERIFGRVWYLILFVLCGIAGNLLSLWIHHGTHAVSAGASGAIFGLAGAMAVVVFRKTVVLSPREYREITRSIIPFILYNILYGLKETNIDMVAHVGGLMAGIGLVWVLPFHREIRKTVQYSCLSIVLLMVAGAGVAQLKYAGSAFEQNAQGLDVETDHFLAVVQKLKAEAGQRLAQKDAQKTLGKTLVDVLAQHEVTLNHLKEAAVIISVDDAKKVSKSQLEAIAQGKSGEIEKLYQQLGQNSENLENWMQDVKKWAKTQGYDIALESAAEKPKP